jgi:hypothetical protein
MDRMLVGASLPDPLQALPGIGSTNNSETVDFEVELASCSTSSPTGSPTASRVNGLVAIRVPALERNPPLGSAPGSFFAPRHSADGPRNIC